MPNQPYILPSHPGDVVKNKLSPLCRSAALRQLNPIHKKNHKVFLHSNLSNLKHSTLIYCLKYFPLQNIQSEQLYSSTRLQYLNCLRLMCVSHENQSIDFLIDLTGFYMMRTVALILIL